MRLDPLLLSFTGEEIVHCLSEFHLCLEAKEAGHQTMFRNLGLETAGLSRLQKARC